MTFDLFCQFVITVTGCSAMYLLASQDPQTRMFAGVIGLIGEPFWFATAFINAQYGILILVLVYGINWARVVYTNYRAINGKIITLFSKDYLQI